MVTTTVRPALPTFRTTFMTIAAALLGVRMFEVVYNKIRVWTMTRAFPHLASRPDVGSSMNMTEGEATISLAMVRRLRCSTESPLSPGMPI